MCVYVCERMYVCVYVCVREKAKPVSVKLMFIRGKTDSLGIVRVRRSNVALFQSFIPALFLHDRVSGLEFFHSFEDKIVLNM